MKQEYLNIMEKSLMMKNSLLDQIEDLSHRQADILLAADQQPEQEGTMETYDKCVDQKDVLIQQLIKLDEGFEALYSRVAVELKMEPAQHAAVIAHMQKLIREITDKGMAIQAQESRNKEALENYFRKQRSQINRGRRSSKAALDYYSNMNKTNVIPPQFMDRKK